MWTLLDMRELGGELVQFKMLGSTAAAVPLSRLQTQTRTGLVLNTSKSYRRLEFGDQGCMEGPTWTDFELALVLRLLSTGLSYFRILCESIEQRLGPRTGSDGY